MNEPEHKELVDHLVIIRHDRGLIEWPDAQRLMQDERVADGVYMLVWVDEVDE